MLFTDSDIATSAALSALDSEVPAVAAQAKPPILIDSGRLSICSLAWQECGRRITQAMQSYVSYPAQTGMPATHIAAVTNVGVPARTQPRIRLNQIVASEANYASMDSQIERWVQYHALYLFYRDASGRLGKDRYEEKMTRFQQIADTSWRGLRSEGLPMVYHPLEAPGATHAFNSGSWGTDNVSPVSGGISTDDQKLLVAITWYDASRYKSQDDKGNAESGPSAQIPLLLPAGDQVHVDISSLNPPNGQPDQVGLSQGLWTPLNATHWNLWTGLETGPLYLQQEDIPIATKTATVDPIFSGRTLGTGQYPDLNLVFQNIAMRG